MEPGLASQAILEYRECPSNYLSVFLCLLLWLFQFPVLYLIEIYRLALQAIKPSSPCWRNPRLAVLVLVAGQVVTKQVEKLMVLLPKNLRTPAVIGFNQSSNERSDRIHQD